jgi:putative ABC transport system permease protein
MNHALDLLLQDARYALRSLRRAPLFVLTVLTIVALGTGVASGLFGVVHHLLVQPFAVPGHEQVMLFTDRAAKRGEIRGGMSVARFLAYRTGTTQLEHVEAYASDDAVLEGRDGSEYVGAARATPGLFAALGVRPRAGRDLNASDAIVGAPAVAMVSERFARAHTEAGASIVGRTVRLDGTPTLIVGVVPAEGELPVGADAWRPLVLAPDAPRDDRPLLGVARLRHGASAASARTELAAIARGETARFPATESDLALELEPIAQGIQDPISPTFEKVASAAVLLTLLVVAANLAGLQLARGAARRREWALRAAIGATPARLSRQSMVESLILTGAGGLIAWWVAAATVNMMRAERPAHGHTFIPAGAPSAVDGTLLLVVISVTLVTGVAFGWVPALHAGRAPAALALRGSGPGTLGSVHARSRAALVIVEVALVARAAGGRRAHGRRFPPARRHLARLRAAGRAHVPGHAAEAGLRRRRHARRLPRPPARAARGAAGCGGRGDDQPAALVREHGHAAGHARGRAWRRRPCASGVAPRGHAADLRRAQAARAPRSRARSVDDHGAPTWPW